METSNCHLNTKDIAIASDRYIDYHSDCHVLAARLQLLSNIPLSHMAFHSIWLLGKTMDRISTQLPSCLYCASAGIHNTKTNVFLPLQTSQNLEQGLKIISSWITQKAANLSYDVLIVDIGDFLTINTPAGVCLQDTYACVYVCVCVGGGVCARARARACVCVWCSGLCSQFPIETLRVRSPPSAVTHVFLLLLYLWVVTNSQMCMSEYECVVGGGGGGKKINK